MAFNPAFNPAFNAPLGVAFNAAFGVAFDPAFNAAFGVAAGDEAALLGFNQVGVEQAGEGHNDVLYLPDDAGQDLVDAAGDAQGNGGNGG